MADSIVIGRVTEDTAKDLAQTLRLVQSIRWFGGALAEARVVVGAVIASCRASRLAMPRRIGCSCSKAQAAIDRFHARRAAGSEQPQRTIGRRSPRQIARSWRLGFGITRLLRKIAPARKPTAIDRWKRR